MNPPSQENDLHSAEHKQDNKQDNRHRRGKTIAMVKPEDLIDRIDKDVCRAGRPWTIHQYIELRKRLKALNGIDHQQEKQDRRQQGKRNMPEERPTSSAIQRSALIEFLRDGLHTRQRDDEIKAQP